MGKLAERLADERRSGVYRLEVIDALEEAAAINGSPIIGVELEHVDSDQFYAACARALAARTDGHWTDLAATLADPAWLPASGHVVLFSGFEAMVRRDPDALAPLLAALQAAAARRRMQGMRFFAAFLDPTRMLPLDPLYDRRRHSSTAVARVNDKGGTA